MNARMILRVLGYILLIYAALMLLPLIAALWFRESPVPLLLPLLGQTVRKGLHHLRTGLFRENDCPGPGKNAGGKAVSGGICL